MCGTTSMAVWLHAHPGLHVAGVKEVRFFDRDDRYALGADWYAEQFDDPRPDQLVGESTPSYLWHPAVPGRIAGLLPHVKLVALLRHPVERLYSHYWHIRGWAPRGYPEIGEVVESALSGDPETAHLVERGQYAEQLARYDAHFAREALHIELFDQLRDDPAATYGSVVEHLGVDPIVPSVVGEAHNRAHHRRSRALHRAMQRTRLWHRAHRLAVALDRLNMVDVDYPPMPADVRKRLLEHYEPHTAALEIRLGRSLPAWFE
jgi:hypothetical protein